jgi:isoaspartyl peptidase/L-asparaginase-like protein (Ntn-hydrolase superfamily)
VGDPAHAAEVALSVLVEEGRGQGGLIVMDWRGRMGWARSTVLMPVGLMSPGRADPELSF